MAEAKTNPVRFGILGCAEIARKVARAIGLAPNAAVVAVGSRSLDKARRFIADNGLPADAVRALGSYEALLDDAGVDAVYIPLPTSLHVRWAVAAAEHGKHVLLEKPTALSVADLDRILDACRTKGVQFMDGTMWVHHPRTAKMRELLSDAARFGELRWMHSTFSFPAPADFLQNDIRVKPDLDAFGALGDAGWYCIRSVLWAADYELPRTVTAFSAVKNEAGVVLSCGASLLWADGKAATLQCSFLAYLTVHLSVVGTKGSLQVGDFVVPYEENTATFAFASEPRFGDMLLGWQEHVDKSVVATDLPQEALMIQEFAELARSIRDSGGKVDEKWFAITRKTQLVLDAVHSSIHKGFQPIDIVA